MRAYSGQSIRNWQTSKKLQRGQHGNEKEFIVYWSNDLLHPAQYLEKAITSWEPIDTSSKTGEVERLRRSDLLWTFARRAGIELFKMCGRGALDTMPRVKHHIENLRHQLIEAIKRFEVRPFYFVSNRACRPLTNDDNYDAFFVEMFEGFCDLEAKTPEDKRILDQFYQSDFQERARVYARITRSAGAKLKRSSG